MSFIPFDIDLEIRGHFGLEGQWQTGKNSYLSWVKSLDVRSCLTSCRDLEQAAEIWIGGLGLFGSVLVFCFVFKWHFTCSSLNVYLPVSLLFASFRQKSSHLWALMWDNLVQNKRLSVFFESESLGKEALFLSELRFGQNAKFIYSLFLREVPWFTQFTLHRLKFYPSKMVSVGILHIESIEGRKLSLSEQMLFHQCQIHLYWKTKKKISLLKISYEFIGLP